MQEVFRVFDSYLSTGADGVLDLSAASSFLHTTPGMTAIGLDWGNLSDPQADPDSAFPYAFALIVFNTIYALGVAPNVGLENINTVAFAIDTFLMQYTHRGEATWGNTFQKPKYQHLKTLLRTRTTRI